MHRNRFQEHRKKISWNKQGQLYTKMSDCAYFLMRIRYQLKDLTDFNMLHTLNFAKT